MDRDQDLRSPGAVSSPQRPDLRSYQFSREEMKVLEECSTESFFKRSLPFGTVLGLATYQAVKSGFLKPNARWGPAPKMMGAVVIGYLIGKVSYQGKCAEKLMALPGSYIGQVLRDRKTKGTFGGSGFDSPTLSPFGSVNTDVYSDVYKDAGPNSSLDLDTDRPVFKGLEDTYKPSLDNSNVGYNSEEMPLPKSPGMTYDELRKKNRDEGGPGKPQPYKIEQAPPISRPPPEYRKKNIYGDDN